MTQGVIFVCTVSLRFVLYALYVPVPPQVKRFDSSCRWTVVSSADPDPHEEASPSTVYGAVRNNTTNAFKSFVIAEEKSVSLLLLLIHNTYYSPYLAALQLE